MSLCRYFQARPREILYPGDNLSHINRIVYHVIRGDLTVLKKLVKIALSCIMLLLTVSTVFAKGSSEKSGQTEIVVFAAAFKWVMINMGISALVLLAVNILERREKTAAK